MANTARKGSAQRTTRETSITVDLNLDGTGECTAETGVGFLNHMLELLARHARFDLAVRASGDLEVDAHHTTEDVGIVLGTAFGKALGAKAGITRFADATVPMQDSLATVAVDICGRAALSYNVPFPSDKIGEFDVELVGEFLQAFANNAALTLHVDLVRGTNAHHIAEAVFKALARALREAVAVDARSGGDVPSTKGTL